MTHDDLQSLLGAYAINAIDADEAKIIESHLRECPQCRAELAELREVAALLGNNTVAAPDGLWDRIAASLEEPPPPLHLEVGPTHRRSRGQLVRLVAVGAAALVIGFLALNVQRLNTQVDQLKQARQDFNNDIASAAEEALTEPGARIARLTGDQRLTAIAVVRTNGQGYFLGSALPALDHRIYQLWGATARGHVVALGTMTNPGTYAFSADPSISAVLVTIESSPVNSPTTDPIVTGQLS